MKWVPFINERYTGERGTFSVKNGIQKGKGLDLGGWLGGGGAGWVGGVASRKKALLSIYLPGFTMRAEVSFRYCQSRSWFVYAPEQTT